MSESITVTGTQAVVAKLASLDQQIQKTYLKAAVSTGAQPLFQQARALVHHRTGLEEKSLMVGARSGKRGATAKVTFNRKLYVQKKGFYGIFEDEGHYFGKRPNKQRIFTAAQRKQFAKDGTLKARAIAAYRQASIAAGRRYTPGSHFLERAFAAKAEQAARIATDKLVDLVEKSP